MAHKAEGGPAASPDTDLLWRITLTVFSTTVTLTAMYLLVPFAVAFVGVLSTALTGSIRVR